MARPRRVWLRSAGVRRIRVLVAALAVFSSVLIAAVAIPAFAGSTGHMDLNGGYLRGPSASHGGDMEWVFHAKADSWSGSRQTVIARWQTASSDKAFRVQFTNDGSLQLVAKASNGSDYLWSTSKAELGLTNGKGKWFRVRLDRSVNNKSKVTFWTSNQAAATGFSNLSWGTAKGSDTEGTPFSWTSTSARWTIGAYKTGSSPFKGEIRAVRVYRGGYSSSGTKVVDVNFRNTTQASSDRKTWKGNVGDTWTVRGSGWSYVEPTDPPDDDGGGSSGGTGGGGTPSTAPGTPADDDKNSIDLPGSRGNYLRSSSFSHGGADMEFVFRAALNDWSDGVRQAIVSRWDGTGASGNSVKVQFTTDGSLQLIVKTTSGADQVYSAPLDDFLLQNGKAYWFRIRFDASRSGGSQTRFWASADTTFKKTADIVWGTAVVSTRSSTATPRSGTARWEIGSSDKGQANNLDGSIMFVRAFRNGWRGSGGNKFLDVDFRYTSDGSTTNKAWDTWADGTGRTWTVNGSGWDYDTTAPNPAAPPNQPPVAKKDTFTIDEGDNLSFTDSKLLSNDSDPDGDSLRLDSVATSSNLGGTITKSSGTYTFSPKSGTTGTDKFIYVLADDAGNTTIGTVQVDIQADAPSGYDITVSPGDDVQKLINDNSSGTSFFFRAGTYRRFSVQPKSGNVFVGANGAILTGAKVLTNWKQDGSRSYMSGQTQGSSNRSEGDSWGRCESGYDHCVYPEDVFVNGNTLWQVSSKSAVGSGKFYFDYGADRIYIGDNPSGKTVETSVSAHAFFGNAFNVTIKNFEIRQYANPGRQGAVNPRFGRTGSAGGNWNVTNNEIHHNHGWGIKIEHDFTIRGNNIHHNGQGGIGGVGDDLLIENNEIARNCISGFKCFGFEGGALKINSSTNATIRNNNVHDNFGHGLHFDIGSRNITFENNTVRNNEGVGIHYEISYDAKIRNNTVTGNGFHRDGSWGDPGIMVLSSRDVEVSDNQVRNNFLGILARQDSRTSVGVRNLYVHDNTIEMRDDAKTGLALTGTSNTSYFTSYNNRFRNNDYILHFSSSRKAFKWLGGDMTASSWKNAGQDTGGTFTYT